MKRHFCQINRFMTLMLCLTALMSINMNRLGMMIQAAPISPSNNRLVTPLHLHSEEKSLNLKTCFSAQVGFEYILSAFEKTFDQYAQRFNRDFDPLDKSGVEPLIIDKKMIQIDNPQKRSTYEQYLFYDGLYLKVQRNTSAKGAFLNKEKSIQGKKLVVSVPYVIMPFEYNK